MMTLNCIVVDDDEVSRILISKFIERTDFLKLAHVFDNAIDASNVLLDDKNNDIDLVYLDVEMPEMTGLELAKSLNKTHPIIFITSKEEYAIEAFEGEILDYLVKPPDYTRFLKASIKAKEQRERSLQFAESENHVFVKSDSKFIRIPFEELLYIEALADYVIFHTIKSKYIVHHTMKGIEKRLPPSVFSRVHRSYILNRNKINQIEDYQVILKDKSIPIGASYKEEFMKKINLL